MIKNTRLTILFFLTLAISFFACTQKPTIENLADKLPVEESDKEVLRHLKEVQWPKAYAEQDTILLDQILGEDFQMIDQTGNWYDKQYELAWIKKNATSYDAFHYEIKRFDILDNGTAFICGTGHILKDSIKSTYQSSNVLIKRDGQWKAVLSHVSGFKNMDED